MVRMSIASLVSVVLVSFVLAGCTSSTSNADHSKFIGTWKTSYDPALFNTTYVVNHTYTFYENGSASGFFSKAWTLRDGHLLITFSSDNLTTTSTYTYAFTNNNRTLTLTDVKMGLPTNYTKIR